MTSLAPRYTGYRFPPAILSHAVWLYHRFGLSLRDVEDRIAECELPDWDASTPTMVEIYLVRGLTTPSLQWQPILSVHRQLDSAGVSATDRPATIPF